MAPTKLEILYQEWQWLVSECSSAMRAARANGASPEELCSLERRHGLRIDAAYVRLTQAEAANAQYQRYPRDEPQFDPKPLF